MARIRSIKPEFPHSESMGRVSRDARLTFIELWTLADDAGRLRGNSRMLASLLFPYDDDARDLIETWLGELERENCIVRYQIEGTSYLQICNWLTHQKIDRPSVSKIPPFDGSSRILASPREYSSGDQGSKDQRIKEGKGSRKGGDQIPVELPLDVDRVFDHWRQVHEHSQAKLDDKRRAVIRKALKTYTVDLLCESISGYLNSPHHMGQNDRNTKYDDIELFLRDSKHVDAGLKFARAPPSANSAVTDHNIRALNDWAKNGSLGQGEICDVTGTARRGIRQEDHAATGRNLLGSLVKSSL